MGIFNRLRTYPEKAKQFVSNLRDLSRFDLAQLRETQQCKLDLISSDLSKWQRRLNGVLTTLEFDPWLANAHNKHRGERCYLLGCGPSLKETDLAKLKDAHVMGVNGTVYLEEVNLKYFASVSHFFWQHHEEALKNVRCERRFLPNYLASLESSVPTSWLGTIERQLHEPVSGLRPWFFSYDPARYVVLGGSVIFVCLQILYYLGYSEVVLLGVDHDYGKVQDELEGRSGMVEADRINAHFIKNYYPEGSVTHIDMGGIERGFQLALDAFQQDGRSLVNATPGTKLEVIPKALLR